MSTTKKITTLTSDTFENSQDYVKNSWEYYKLKAFLHTSELSFSLVKYLLYGFLGLMALFLLSISLALYLGKLFENTVSGFATVGALYLILLFGVFLGRKKLEEKIIIKLSKSLLHDE